MVESDRKGKQPLGKVDVTKKAVKIQELGDKVGIAVQQFESAKKKFEAGQDSYKEWANIIRLLDIQIKDIQHFLAVAHHNMGVIHAGRREFEKAEKKFLEAIKLDNDYAVAWYNLAVTYKHMNDSDKTQKCIAKAKELGYTPGSCK